jgi:hypothetical protein
VCCTLRCLRLSRYPIGRKGWEDVHIKEGHIEVKSAKSKTKVRRLIEIPKNLKAWLLPYMQPTGSVCPFANLALQFANLAKAAGIPWMKNSLRHSFISYRVALTKNVQMVSLEAGNSPSVISRNYLKCVSLKGARQWFGIFPPKTLRAPGGLRSKPAVTVVEEWAKAGWQQMQRESRSPAPLRETVQSSPQRK